MNQIIDIAGIKVQKESIFLFLDFGIIALIISIIYFGYKKAQKDHYRKSLVENTTSQQPATGHVSRKMDKNSPEMKASREKATSVPDSDPEEHSSSSSTPPTTPPKKKNKGKKATEELGTIMSPEGRRSSRIRHNATQNQ